MNKKFFSISSIRSIISIAFILSIIIFSCMFFCVYFVQKSLLESKKNSALNSALLVANNFHISDSEVAYMKSLTFNQMAFDPINTRLAKIATGKKFCEPIISIYIEAPLSENEIKYTINNEEDSSFWEEPIGTKLDLIWLLNMAVDKEGNAVLIEREDIFRYSIQTQDLKKAFKEKTAFSSHLVDEWGDVITGSVPIYTTEGNYVGILGIDFDYGTYNKATSKILLRIVFLLFISLIMLIILFLILYKKYSNQEKKARNLVENEKENLISIMNNISVGIYLLKHKNGITTVEHANSSIVNMLGRDIKLESQKKPLNLYEYIYPDDLGNVKKAIPKIKEGNYSFSFELRLMNGKTKDYMWIILNGKSIRNLDGSVDIYLAFIDDSERKRLQNIENSYLFEQAENKATTEFLSRMSHDMRTPMNGILGMTELSNNETDISVLQDNIKIIKQSATYLLGLINDTLDFQKIQSGKLTLNPSVVNSEILIKNVVDMIHQTAEKKEIVFEINRDLNLYNSFVKADEMRLKQIFINLLSNAVKFTPKGGKIEWTFKILEENEKSFKSLITISDSGIGMSKDYLQNQIFKPFSQEKNEYTNQYAGSGLGLSIVKSLVELMGGRLEVESELGEGTIFKLYLNFEKVTDEDVNKEIIYSKEFEKQVQISLKGKYILIAEDHLINAEIAKRLLEKCDCHTKWAKNGKECLDFFIASKINEFDAILMDIRMPIMNGLEASKEIRKSNRSDAKTIPIIAMTANAFSEDIKECLAAGMNTHLSKPIDSKLLYQTLSKFINN